ncbi:MAG TPA: S-layer homology domain-containing protein [Clostridia bacterium]|nr:S-layer homology domain-containing protein [Clostridia bacterium]
MSKFRKILVAAVVLSMVLSLVGTGFAAAPKVVTKVFSDTQGKDCEQAMAMLGGLGIYKGDSGIGGPARPDDPITRAEVAAVVTRMLGKEKTAKAMENYAPPFVDSAKIPSWAWGYVSVASSLGIVKGYPDGSFGPNNNVTHAEMLAMLVRALGHDSLVKGVWPTNYIVYGHSLGLTEGVEVFANLPATRGEVAIMAANAMEADVYDEVAEKEAAGTLLTGELRSGFESREGTVTKVDVDKSEITIKDADNKDHIEDLASQVVLIGVKDLDELVNLHVKAVLVSDKVVVIEVTEEANVISGVLDEIKADKDQIVLEDGTKIDYDPADTDVVINGEEGFDVEDKLVKLLAGADADITVKVVMGEGDDKDVAKVIRAEVFDAPDTYLKSDPDIAETEDEDNTITVADLVYKSDEVIVDDDTTITLDGDAAELADLEKDMVVYVATKGAKGILKSDTETPVAFKIAAYSEAKDGKFVSATKYRVSATEYYYKVKYEVDDKDYTIRMSSKFTLPDDLHPGDVIKIVLNADGYGRNIVQVTAATNYVKILGVATVSDAVYSVTVDRAGEEQEYDVAESKRVEVTATAVPGTVGELTLVGDEVTGYMPIDLVKKGDVAVEFTVVTADADAGVVTVKDADGNYYTSGDDVVVYKEKKADSKEVGDYIGVAGLSKGDKVYVGLDGSKVAWVLLKY